MKCFALIVTLCAAAATAVADGPPLAQEGCRNPSLQDAFRRLVSPSATDVRPDYARTVLHPFGQRAVTCLKRWVEDGGAADAVPLSSWRGPAATTAARPPTRMTYRVQALTLLGQVARADRTLGAWIRERLPRWPEPLASSALTTLGVLRDAGARSLLRREAQTAAGARRQAAWVAFGLVSPTAVVRELGALAAETKEWELYGEALIAAHHPSVIPALKELMAWSPDRALVYRMAIQDIQDAQE